MNTIISNIKKIVNTFNTELLYPRLKHNKPNLLVAPRKFKADPAGNPMIKVYRDDISRGPLF
jgi:hypothetical protein